jgi:hypothetical protein
MRLHHATALAVLATLALASGAMAQTATGTGTANSSSSSGAVAIGGAGSAQAGGGSVHITNNGGGTSRIRQSGSLKTVPGVAPPGLGAAGVETCSTPGMSAGASVVGFGGAFSAGGNDPECNLRLWARTVYAMGQRDLAGAIMAQSPTITRAMEILDSQRQPDGRVVYGAPVRGSFAQGTASRGALYSGCKRWSGNAVGVGSCLY